MYRFLAAVLAVTILLNLSGCTFNEPTNKAGTVFAKREEKSTEKEAYTLLFEQRCGLSLYEPSSGHYVGAGIQGDAGAGSIRAFEQNAGKHNVYVYEVIAGDEIDESIFLECIANNKYPYFIIHPPETKLYERAKLQKAATELGKINMPIFAEIYPDIQSEYLANDYVELFKYAYDAIKKYAPNTAVVFGAQSDDVTALSYYPGNDYTDWVRLGLKLGADEKPNLDFLYLSFQKEKPLILNVSVSHFSKTDYKYRELEAAYTIKELYQSLEVYPRIKMINYLSYDESPEIGTENYLISSQTEILKAYANSVTNLPKPRITTMSALVSLPVEYATIRSPFTAYKIDNEYYVSELSVIYDLREKPSGQSKQIDGQPYYPASRLKATEGIRFVSSDETP